MLTQNSSALKLLLTDDLYRIREKPPVSAVSAPAAESPTFNLPAMRNGCLILLNEPGFERLSPTTEDVLTKVFTARKADFLEAGLINLAYTPITFNDIKKHAEPQTMLLLGIDSEAAGFDNLAYNTPLTRDGIRILYTYTMQDILSDENRKKLFWEGFKRLW